MDAMHREFFAFLNRFPYDLLIDLIERKLAEAGVTLKRRQRAALCRDLERQDWSDLKLCFGWELRNRKVVLNFTDVDLSEIEKKFNHVLETLPEIIASVTDEIAPRIRRDLDRKWKAEQKRQHREHEQFSKRLYRRWREPLSQLEQFIVVSTELGESVNHRLREQNPCPNPFTVEVQTRLHARACQIAREVLTLLYAGFAEGAMARWRALHELAVVSLFIGHDEKLAERYRSHEAVESWKAAVQYRKHTEKLGLEPITDAEFKQMEADVATLKKRFGKGYGESYGWAVERLRKIGKRATFDKIEEAAELGHLRPYYQLASHSVHANPKGAFYRLGLVDQTEMLLAGPSSYGLADAGQNTAISLGQITSALVSLAPTLDEIVAMKVAISMVDHVLERFAHVQRELQAEEGECEAPSTVVLRKKSIQR